MLRLWFVFYWIVNRDPLIKECLLLKHWVYLLRCTVLILVIVLSKILVAKLLGWLGFDIVLRQIKVQRIEHFRWILWFYFQNKENCWERGKLCVYSETIHQVQERTTPFKLFELKTTNCLKGSLEPHLTSRNF